MTDALGDRMKFYEGIEADRRFIPMLPTICRIDGRSFSSFTRGMGRPFDEVMTQMMIDTTHHLVRETNACMGYTQSDEITLAWHSTSIKSQIWFDGRIHKMVSQLAAQATIAFYGLCVERAPSFADRMPTFDARVWQVPNRTEGANVFLWREWDATKNSISMAASALYSEKQLFGKNGADKQQMLFDKGINWNNYPAKFKRGTFAQRREIEKPFSTEEIEKLPARHMARANPALTVLRSEWRSLEMPPFASVENREGVIFEGREPELISTPQKL